jgi:hypothetical protein
VGALLVRMWRQLGAAPPAPRAFTALVSTAQSVTLMQHASKGEARFVPRPGFWHSSAWNSAGVYACPNMRACSRDRHNMSECQASPSHCIPALYNASVHVL